MTVVRRATPPSQLKSYRRTQAEQLGRRLFVRGMEFEKEAETREDPAYYRYAIEAYNEIPEESERLLYIRAHTRAGRLLSYQLGRPDEALAQFEEARRKDPRHPIVQYEFGYVSYQLGNFSEAIEAFDQAGVFAGVNAEEIADFPRFELQTFYLRALAHEARASQNEKDLLELRDALSAWRDFLDSCQFHEQHCQELERTRAESHRQRLQSWLTRFPATELRAPSE